MPTRFRLTSDTTAPAVSPAYQSYSHANATRRQLLTVDTSALTSTAQTPDGSDHLVAGDTSHVQFVSDPLGAQTFTIGDAFDYAVQGLEAHAANNLQVQIYIALVSNDGTSELATLRSKVAEGTELGTSLANRYYTGTLSGGYTCTGGERLVVEFSVTGTPTNSGGTQGHNATLRWGGAGAGGDLPENDTATGTTLNPWLEFANTLVWSSLFPLLPVAPHGRRFTPHLLR